jgi:hypothetical protein
MSKYEPCAPKPLNNGECTFPNHLAKPALCRGVPKPMLEWGWSLADVLNGELLTDRNQARGTIDDLLEWRSFPVSGYSVRYGPQCYADWATDAAAVLMPSGRWHSVLALADALNILGPSHACGEVKSPTDKFPHGAIALLAWEAGQEIGINKRGQLTVQLGLSRENVGRFLQKGGVALGWSEPMGDTHLLAHAVEGGAA